MALGGAGYWGLNYWSQQYWHTDYWAAQATAAALPHGRLIDMPRRNPITDMARG